MRPPRSLTGGLENALKLARRPGRSHRRVWARRGRAHVEVRALHQPGREDLARRVEKALRGIDGVHWTEINAVLGRVIVDFDSDVLDVDDLIDVVAGVEEAQQVHRERFPLDRPDLPGDVEPIRRVSAAIVADLTGLGLTAFGNLLRATPLPIEAASVLSMIESEVRLRRILEDRLGPALTDLGLATANALAQGLAQGRTGLVVDLAHRASLLSELQARRRCWEMEEPTLCPQPAEETVGRGYRLGLARRAGGRQAGGRPSISGPGRCPCQMDRSKVTAIGLH